ncbi:MAG TPA: FtsX-like permease family protein, partial [Candidatus Sulfopaludibacter sp.]|nr:FtsX-like permease family protein [Candidatus Sulfopaludibacter sp.]
AFVLAVSLATGILFGLFPALAGSRADLHSILKEAGRGGSGLRRNKARAALVMSEVSLAVVLLVGAALLIRTFQEAYSANRGFATKDVVTMRTLLSGPKYASTRGTATVIREGLERLRALPGVEAAAATCCVPLLGNYDLNIEIAGRPLAAGQTMQAGWSTVSPGFFETFRVPVKRGRTFTDRDDGSSQPVVLINEMLARRYWKDRDPLQERLIIGRGLMKEFQGEPPRQIVGIVGDVRDEILDERARPMVYVPQAQLTDAANAFFMVRQAPLAWVVRAQAGRRGMTSAIRDCLRQATHLPVSDIHSMEEVVWLSTGRQRFSMLLMAAFGTSALLLAAVGIYGLMAYTVEQRTQEIGIRLALGANAGQVRNMVVRQGMALAVAGLAAGLAAAWGIARLFESLLFGVKAHDPAVFLLAPAILCIAGLAAVWIPAARASRVNPIDSLRYE